MNVANIVPWLGLIVFGLCVFLVGIRIRRNERKRRVMERKYAEHAAKMGEDANLSRSRGAAVAAMSGPTQHQSPAKWN